MSNIEAKKDSAPELGLVPGSALLVSTYSDESDKAVALGPISKWPNGVEIQEQRNKWCDSYLVMRCPSCGDIDEPLHTDGDAYECRVCSAIHDFPPNIQSEPRPGDALTQSQQTKGNQ